MEAGIGSSPAEVEAIVARIFQRYLDPAPQGCWLDHFDATGTMIADKIPTSSLYHVFLAFAELLRVSRGRSEGPMISKLDDGE
jgi:mannose/cellobiose epimerase-like protein (N-acyl-D-glucosamine 2-epimerase family)